MKKPKPRAKWTPFQPATVIPKTEAQIEEMAKALGETSEVIKATLDDQAQNERVLKNSRYQVHIREVPDPPGFPALLWLSLRRIDREQVGRERFRDFQRIKNELVGPENEAVELYPAESRLVDTSNQYHLFVIKDPTIRLPFGFTERGVVYASAGGAVQTPPEDDE
jgi:hypothetical protein